MVYCLLRFPSKTFTFSRRRLWTDHQLFLSSKPLIFKKFLYPLDLCKGMTSKCLKLLLKMMIDKFEFFTMFSDSLQSFTLFALTLVKWFDLCYQEVVLFFEITGLIE